MALTISTLKRAGMKSLRTHIAVASSNENYATGGIACPASSLGMSKVDMAYVQCQTFATTAAYLALYDGTAEKVKLFWVDTTVDGAAPVEVPNATAVGVLLYGIVAFGT